MAIEISYETYTNDTAAEYPIMYKVFRDDGQEVGRSVAAFEELPAGVGASYILEFKEYMANMISQIPDADSMTAIERSNIVKLVYAISHLGSYVPVDYSIGLEEATE
jgi:hypothetical protein